jgi:hypothetical protein
LNWLDGNNPKQPWQFVKLYGIANFSLEVGRAHRLNAVSWLPKGVKAVDEQGDDPRNHTKSHERKALFHAVLCDFVDRFLAVY